MVLTRRPLFYGLCLLAGSLLAAVAGVMHPWLAGDGAAQLSTIAATAGWRTIHWGLLFGFPLMYMGLIGVALRHHDTPGSAPARAGVLLAGFAFGVWSLNVLFMYDMLHPVGLAAERLATFALSLVAYVFGWTILNGKVYPRWLGWAAFAVAVANAAVAVGFNEFSPNLYYGQALFVAWLVATAAVMLAERRPV